MHAKLRFGSNARVTPGAATGAAPARQLLNTATQGAVNLFNAVAKAQRTARAGMTKESGRVKAKGKPVSRDSFMSMIKASVKRANTTLKPNVEVVDGESKKTGWLAENFATANSN